jgi:hypothetical protein
MYRPCPTRRLKREAIPVFICCLVGISAYLEGLSVAYLYIALAVLPSAVMAGVLIWRYGFLERQIKG